MRIIYRICALMTLFTVLANALGVLAIWGKVTSNDVAGLTSLNWDFLLPSMIVSCFVLLLAASGVMTVATDNDLWKSKVNFDKMKSEYHKKIVEVNDLRDKLAIAVLKYEKKLKSNEHNA